MSVEQLEQSVLGLKPEDRRRFLDWLCEHEEELFASADDIHPEVQAEILQRRDEALAHPEKLEDWNTAFPRMKQSFDELRRKNPYSR
jgi:recombinational DNA repair ATPase RecF